MTLDAAGKYHNEQQERETIFWDMLASVQAVQASFWLSSYSSYSSYWDRMPGCMLNSLSCCCFLVAKL